MRWAAIQALVAVVDCLRARAASIFQAADLGVFRASSGDFPGAFTNANPRRFLLPQFLHLRSAPSRRLLTIGKTLLQLLTVFGRPNCPALANTSASVRLAVLHPGSLSCANANASRRRASTRRDRETPMRPESACAPDASAASVRRTSDSTTRDNPAVGSVA